jgi:carbamoyltransferase
VINGVNEQSNKMKILGVTSFIHASSAALLVDGELVAAADEERFSRRKFEGDFPKQSIRFCLERAGITLSDIDWLAFYWNPWKAIGPRLGLMAANLPHSLAFFRKGNDSDLAVRGDFRSWWRMVNVGRLTRRAMAEPSARFRSHHVEHHLAHAASAYYLSPWDDALILSLDGTGEWTTTLMARGRGSRIEKVSEINYPHSLGVLYGAITQYLGYRIYEDEWKVMGLAAYGTPRHAAKVRRMIRLEDGRFSLDMNYFSFHLADKCAWYGPRFVETFGPPRKPDEPIESERFVDLAASFQLVTEEAGLHLVRHLLRIGGGTKKLCMAGGVALNAVLNGKILAETDVEDLFVQPAANDPGAALGAALYLHHAVQNGQRVAPMRHVYLGPDYGEERMARALTAKGLKWEKRSDIAKTVAGLLAEGKVIGWFQGRMEYGPRALGNRSILADPRRSEMKDVVNAQVKFRESFRPFAPAILAEKVQEYFVGGRFCPFMNIVLPVRPEKKDVIPAVTHADGTGRLQTVEREINPRFYQLLDQFYRITGIPVLMNTSFNLQGEPVVCTPEDAVASFLNSGLDILVLGDYLCAKDR